MAEVKKWAVLFDLDGTLVDTAALWRAALTALVGRRQAVPAGAVDGLRGLTALAAVRTVHRRLGWSDVDTGADVTWVERFVRQRHLDGAARWDGFGLRLVEDLRRQGVPVGLVTSSSREIVNALLTHNDVPQFDTVVCGDDVTRPKPAPDPYLLGARRLQFPPSRCVAVEDSPTGVSSAVAAGCPVVLVGDGESPAWSGRTRRLADLTVPALFAAVPAGSHPHGRPRAAGGFT
ncbi:HAD family hydrolase [Micromonospora sp. C31]|uniref:HAD family hydrolase n=1 Tax=Micromonospora sp. C31 TaxID=2824876 RepID=UPI001B3802B7|nr:HAD family hydrolase [Micromonospora sp. C31]MBQ1075935.1 HAD family hydrolase [Micromonospora sp. C31]